MNVNKSSANDENHLRQQLLYLKLPSFLQQYDATAQHATQQHWTHIQYLAELTQTEVNLRRDRSIQRRIRLARFPVVKTLDEFDWNWPKKINRLQVQDLFRLSFMETKSNVIFLGGVGLVKRI